MNHQEQVALISELNLSSDEKKKRENLIKKNPHVAKKLANISKMEERGEISPIIRIEKSYLCNFKCTHCSAEYYMDRHLEKVLKVKEDRSRMTLDDIRSISKQADELGLARFVITGGEPLVMRDFDAVRLSDLVIYCSEPLAVCLNTITHKTRANFLLNSR